MNSAAEIKDRITWMQALTEAQEALLGAVAHYGSQGDEVDLIKHLEEVKDNWRRWNKQLAELAD